jgi:hypothetical protein
VFKQQKDVGLAFAPLERSGEPQIANTFYKLLVNRYRRLTFQTFQVKQVDRLLVGEFLRVEQQKVSHQLWVNQESPDE